MSSYFGEGGIFSFFLVMHSPLDELPKVKAGGK